MFIIQFLFFFNQCHIHEHRKPLNVRKNSHFEVMAAMVILLKSANSIFGVQLKWILARRATFDETYRNFIRESSPNGITIIVIQQPELRSIESYRVCFFFWKFNVGMAGCFTAQPANKRTSDRITLPFQSTQRDWIAEWQTWTVVNTQPLGALRGNGFRYKIELPLRHPRLRDTFSMWI